MHARTDVPADSVVDPTATSDRHRWSSSLVVAMAFAAGMVFYSFWFAPWYYHNPFHWGYPGDAWMIVDGARFVAHGALPYAYQGTQSLALPLSFVVFAPIGWLVDHYHLTEGSPYIIPHPQAWPYLLGYALIFPVFLFHAVRAIAWDLGLRSRIWATQVLSAIIALVPIYYWGHYEDALALIFVLHALRRLIRADYRWAALFISVAISFKQDAAVLLPLVVFMAPSGQRVRTAVAGCALPGSLALMCLSLDWPDASKALFSPINLVAHYQGHSSFYVTWFGAATSKYSRTAGLVGSVVAAWYLRRVRSAPQILAAAALLFLVRPLSEAINYSYYWGPCLVLAGLVGVAAHKKFRVRDWAWPLLAVCWANPRGTGAVQPWWWAGESILILLTAAQTLDNCGIDLRSLARFADPIKKITQRPITNDMSAPMRAGETTWIR